MLAPVAVCVYAFPSSVISAVPLLVDLPYGGVAVTGVLAGVTLGAGTLVGAPATPPRSLDSRRRNGAGGGGLRRRGRLREHRRLPWLVAHRPLLGSGGGLCLAAGLTLTARLAAPTRRGALTALFLAIAYLGFAVPFVMAVARAGLHARDAPGVAAGVTAELAVRLLPVARSGRL